MKEWKDIDLKTPSHDRIMINLMNPDAWKRIIRKLFGIDTEDIRIEPEFPITIGRYDQIIGFLDFRVEIYYQPKNILNNSDSGKLVINCEIKITEPSFGGVVRQLKRYRHNLYYPDNEKWLVISPYKEWENPLASQGIYWLSSDDILPKSRKDFKPDREVPNDHQ